MPPVLQLVDVEDFGGKSGIRVQDLETRSYFVLNSWLPHEGLPADFLPAWRNRPELQGRKVFVTQTVEGRLPALRSRVDWKILKVGDISEELGILEDLRSKAQKERAWVRLGELAAEIQVIQEGLGRFRKFVGNV
jgi:hypothetical protein